MMKTRKNQGLVWEMVNLMGFIDPYLGESLLDVKHQRVAPCPLLQEHGSSSLNIEGYCPRKKFYAGFNSSRNPDF